MSDTRQFSVWHDVQEQWDADDIDEPALRCQARNAVEAAEKLADDGDANYGEYVVRDDATGAFRTIELQRSWRVKRDRSTTLADLCAP